MTRKRRRGVLIATAMALLGVALGIALLALQESIVFFRTPSDIAANKISPNIRFRLGGLVVEGSIVRGANGSVRFDVSDGTNVAPVNFMGVLPDLFREGQGVVAEGVLDRDGTFTADTVLAKHDENYMPREVAEALKDKGIWRGEPRDAGSLKGEVGP